MPPPFFYSLPDEQLEQAHERGQPIQMPLLLAGLLLLFLVPWLGLFILAILVLLMLLIPLGFAARSFAWLFIGPKELFRILSDRKVRRNHALEHATINILEENYGIAGLSGMAFSDGFAISGFPYPEPVLDASRRALDRLASGEPELAVNRRCGTTLVVINTVSSVLFILLLLVAGRITIFTVFLSLVAGWILGTAFSPMVQRFVTTDRHVASLTITGVEMRQRPSRFSGVTVFSPPEVFVHTRFLGEAVEAEVVAH